MDAMNAIEKSEVIMNKIELSFGLFRSIAYIWDLDDDDVKILEAKLNDLIILKHPEGV